jgi:hypothetical protein
MPMVKRRATGRRPRTRETVLTAVAIALLTLAFTVLAAPSASADLHEHPSVPPTASAPVMLAGTGLHIAGPVIIGLGLLFLGTVMVGWAFLATGRQDLQGRAHR